MPDTVQLVSHETIVVQYKLSYTASGGNTKYKMNPTLETTCLFFVRAQNFTYKYSKVTSATKQLHKLIYND